MTIKTRDAAEFTRLLEALAKELVDANIFFKLRTDLSAAMSGFSTEMHQSWTFWSLSLQSLLDAAVFRLCKIYDHHGGVVSLPNVLEAIRNNTKLFSKENFLERLKDNPHAESLAKFDRQPNMAQLETDLVYVNYTSNPDVKVLIQLRHNYYAHRSAKDAITAADLAVKYPLSMDQVATLLQTGMDIVNRYSVLYRALSYSIKIVGRDDYRYVLDVVRADLKRQEQELEAQMRL